MEERVKKLIETINSGNIDGFLNNLDVMAASKAYLVIRDNITSNHIKMIKDSGKENYQKFQDIKIRAKQSWDYDHRHANMEDVNRACMNVYTLVLRFMNAQNSDYQSEFNAIKLAINKLEEKAGIEPTVWDAQDNDGGNDNVSDVQRVEENS